ncbi:methionyl-tRNA formyltransferase [Candidatus Nomurabacteria bacterium RIFCSPLOWO2_02_FULL_40_10]|uniref:Methionyl-tRNA formyltransferase n=2 Tax=Candidatus Nomuraibacteriota TaxID=1752729 RepID=A0A1F6Y0Z3_9BACT|nr:MAG: methionyl-tRNA formyltransferase [Candidatus Nomurabacteria bacterium RIFCSPHIGHO2_01_FULL_39_10]OGJ00048.1 MAG: methionyl-tRNA formyltransferase [Candidatus Nomurabacteria bacterium RIFCSPLOWO2_02_FULL_40_10]
MNTNNINFIFFGTPDVASETLEILKQNSYLPSLIITSPDKPQGRKMIVTPPPVKIWAIENNIPYLQPEKLNEEFTRELEARSYNLFVVVAYGKIIPEKILNMPKFGSINIHYSLLPKYRGASPVESAILNGDTETGVTIQKMAFKLDSGAIITQEKVSVFPDEKVFELRKRLIKIGGELLVKTLQTPSFLPLAKGEVSKAVGVKQDESQATFCKKIKKEDGLVNLEEEPPNVLYNKFRAYTHWPRVFFFKNSKRIIITDAELTEGKFVIKKILPEGKKEIKYEEFLKFTSK